MSQAGKDAIDDVDDDLFISKKPQNYIFADKKANDINEKTSRRLLNARSLVEESERVGQSALENLSSQRETLERVDNDLDNINSITRSTQKHLNNMKSFFGGFKSLFSNSNSNTTAPTTIVPTTKQGIPRSATIANMPSNTIKSSSHPTSSSSLVTASTTASSINNNTYNNKSQVASKSQHPSKLDDPEDEFQANLSELGFGLGRLKEMAMQLGEEIGDQNDMLDRITEKSERASDSMNHQNRQLQQLLKKG